MNRECTVLFATNCSSDRFFWGQQFVIGVRHSVKLRATFLELCPWLLLLPCVNGNPETGNRHHIFPFLVLNFMQKNIPSALKKRISSYTSDLLITITAVIKYKMC